MDCGIDPGHSGVIEDPDFRFELFSDILSIRSREPLYSLRKFEKNKEIPKGSISEIIKEFLSYDPTGERWGEVRGDITK